MAEEKPAVVATDNADATKFAELNAELTELRAEREQNAARIAKLEADAMNARFTAEVEGTVKNGVRWFGDHEKHKTMLCDLALAFGEKSPQVNQYIQQNREYAAQLGASALLEELGSDGQAAEQLSALEELNAKAAEINAGNPKLTKEQAFAQAMQDHPALYERHVKEARGGK